MKASVVEDAHVVTYVVVCDLGDEVLSLISDVAEGQDGAILHAHVVLGLPDGTTRGGHLLVGLVFPTLEVVMTETPRSWAK